MTNCISEYLVNISNIQRNILSFIDNDQNTEENFQNLIQLLDEQKILDNIFETRLILQLISRILQNHYRAPNFFSKIQRVLLYFKDSINKCFSNYKIFKLFKKNKRILLFLLKEKVLNIDSIIYKEMINSKNKKYEYIKYFLPEIKTFFESEKDENYEKKNIINHNEETKENNESYINMLCKTILNDDFEEKRELGENDVIICKMIQKDSIEEFIIEYNKTNFYLQKNISPSIFETNYFLIKRSPTLIEYATFFGSFQIFRFLFKNGAQLTSSLWLYGVHCDNPELISLLEENCPKPESFKNCWIEAVKCHHNDVANYLQNNYNFDDSFKFFKYYNFEIMLNSNVKKEMMLYYCCKYNYYCLCEILLKKTKVDINFKKPAWVEEERTIGNKGETIKFEIIKRLVSQKTPFCAACINSNLDIIKLLMSYNVNCNLHNSYLNKSQIIENKTGLYLAVIHGNVDVVELLLSSPMIEVDTFCNVLDFDHYMSDKTPLYAACEYGEEKIVELLLKNPNIDVNKMSEIDVIKNNLKWAGNREKKTPLYAAVENRNSGVVKLLLNCKDIDINKMNDIYKDEDYNVKYKSNLNDDRCVCYNVGKYRRSALHIAVKNKNRKMIKLLLKHKDIDVNKRCEMIKESWDTNSKDLSDEFSDIDNVECITQDDDQIDTKTAMHIAVDNNDNKAVKLLLSHPKIDVNIQEEWEGMKRTALYKAVYEEKTKLARLLLSHPKIDVNILEASKNQLETVFCRAIQNGDIKTIKLLISNPKIDVNVPQTTTKSFSFGSKDEKLIQKNSPLQLAYQKNNKEIINLLLQRNDINK